MILRVLGGLLVLALSAVCAVLEVFYLPLRVGAVPVPLSILAAVVGNVVFTRAMYEVAGSVWTALLPGAVWLAVIGRSAIARPEGDLLITDGGASTGSAVVNLGFLLLGAVALAFAVGTLRRTVRSQGTPATLGRYQSSPDARLGRYQSSPDAGALGAAEIAAGQPPDTAGKR